MGWHDCVFENIEYLLISFAVEIFERFAEVVKMLSNLWIIRGWPDGAHCDLAGCFAFLFQIRS